MSSNGMLGPAKLSCGYAAKNEGLRHDSERVELFVREVKEEL